MRVERAQPPSIFLLKRIVVGDTSCRKNQTHTKAIYLISWYWHRIYYIYTNIYDKTFVAGLSPVMCVRAKLKMHGLFCIDYLEIPTKLKYAMPFSK